MLENFLTLPYLIIYAALYGTTMKIADLFNEHGMKSWFKGSNIIFGILWGIFGGLLILSNIYVANVLLAMIVAFIFRMRIDYKNHAIATVIIVTTFLLRSEVEPLIFLLFLANFIIFGSAKDYFDDVLKSEGILKKISESGWYYVIPTFIYGFFTNQWIVFYVFTTYIIFYDIVKYSLELKLRNKLS
ncbi:MAG: hypothetical protein V1826_01625 [bacterium]